VRSRTAGVMTTLMRNGRDRRLGKLVKCDARKERVLLVGTRSADHIRASGQSGCIQRPDTWLHPNASLKRQIFPLHRGRRPYMAQMRNADRLRNCLLIISDNAPDRGRISGHCLNHGKYQAALVAGRRNARLLDLSLMQINLRGPISRGRAGTFAD
jgi:hypothetical protein